MEKTIEERNSTKFSINAKGQWSAEVKVYAVDPQNAYDTALEIATKAEDHIRKKNFLGEKENGNK